MPYCVTMVQEAEGKSWPKDCSDACSMTDQVQRCPVIVRFVQLICVCWYKLWTYHPIDEYNDYKPTKCISCDQYFQRAKFTFSELQLCLSFQHDLFSSSSDCLCTVLFSTSEYSIMIFQMKLLSFILNCTSRVQNPCSSKPSIPHTLFEFEA